MRTMGMLGLAWITTQQPRHCYSYAFSPRHHAISSVSGSYCSGRHHATHHVACLPTEPATCYNQEYRRRTDMMIDRKMDILSRVHADPVGLVRWFRNLGGYVGNVRFKECPGKGWGFCASQDLEEGETLLVLPSEWCITLSPTHRRHTKDTIQGTRKKYKKNANGDGHWNQLTTKGSDTAANTVTSQPYWMVPPPLVSLIDMVPPEFKDIRLGLVLLAERYKVGESAWWPYLRNLPHSVVGIPLCSFDDAEMVALQDDVVRQKVDARSTFMMEFVKDVLDTIPPGPYSPFGDERITVDKLAWAAAVASSRAFRFDERLQLAGGATVKGDPVIVPFIDMVNVNVEDSEGVNVKVEAVGWNEGSEAETRGDRQAGKERAAPAGSVRLVATRAIGKNESLEMAPVCIVRDDHVNTIGNQELLCNYGFVDGGSRQERASIEFSKNVLQYARLLVCITNEKFGSSVGENELEPWQHRVLMDLKLEGPGADRTVYLGGDRSHARLPVDPRLLAALRVMYARSKEEVQGKSAEELADYETGKLSTYNERRVLSILNGLINMLKWKTTLEDDEMLLYGRKVTPDLLEREEAISSIWKQDSTAKDPAVPKSGGGDGEEEQEYCLDMDSNGKSEPDLHRRSKLALDELNSRLKAGLEAEIVNDVAAVAAGEDDDHDDDQELHRKDGSGSKKITPLKINSELSANMVLAVKYRLAQKRSMREVALILRAQLAQIGPVKGMRAVADNAAVTES